VIAPLSSFALACLGPREAAVSHPLALRDEIDEDAEERQNEHQNQPENLGPTADVMSAEDVCDDPEQQQEPGATQMKKMHIVQKTSSNG
jgi:hypothetical protein